MGASNDTIDDAMRVAVDPPGDVVVLGIGRTRSETQTVFLARLADDGAVLWLRELPSTTSPFAYPAGVALTRSGDIVALVGTISDAGAGGVLSKHTGRALTAERASPTRGSVQRYDDGGTRLWTREVAIGERNQVLDVDVDHLGRAHVSGWTRRTVSLSDIAALYAIVDANGVVTHETAYGDPDMHAIAWEVAVSESGNVFVAGPTG